MGSIDIIRSPILQPEVEKTIPLNKIDFTKVIQRMDREMETTSKFYGFIFPSLSQFRENLLRANLQLCHINTIYYFLEQQQTQPAETPKLTDSITSPHSSLDPKIIIPATLKAIHKDFKFDRLYVMTVVKTLRSLKIIEYFMVIVPFCSHKKVIGILGMDNITSKKIIPPDVVSSIAIVANELGIAMENAAAFREAKAISLKDGLTGLLNRLAIDELLAKSFRKAVEGKETLSLVMLDIDFFKKVNDTFGHQTGDIILKLIATTLKKLSRPFDHVGRYGGEEFIIILNNTDLSEALVYAERIRKEIEHLGKLLANRFPGLSLTVSAGVSQYQKNIKNRDALITKADKALYVAKKTGRNKVSKG